MILKAVTMISWELHPFHTLGGTAYVRPDVGSVTTGVHADAGLVVTVH